MRRLLSFTALFLAMVGAAGYCWYVARATFPRSAPPPPPSCCAHTSEVDYSDRISVPLNGGGEVPTGFRGDTHPILRRAELELTAHWEFDRTVGILTVAPPSVGRVFRSLQAAIPRRRYSEREFSRFLPADNPVAVGQTWALDLDTVAGLLKQFHPRPSMRLVARGRRPGPDGGFAILRAVSASHLDVRFRVHAEFEVTPAEWKLDSPIPEIWYSPACFLGRMVIDRTEGTVQEFVLRLPTDSALNVHLTHATGHLHSEAHGWMSVARMELAGGQGGRDRSVAWQEQMEPDDADARLAKLFYTHRRIDWVAFDRVQRAAREQNRPILVVSAMGDLENQTC